MSECRLGIRYSAFGLCIESELELPELPELSVSYPSHGAPDAVVRMGDLTGLWADAARNGEKFVAHEGTVLFRIPDAAIFEVQGGCSITVSREDGGADDDRIRLYVLGTCMGALLLQRGVLPLHGSAVAIGGRAYAIVGESGAGKSTLASTFLRMGYRLLTDDVIAVRMDEASGSAAGAPIAGPLVLPAYPQQKLWQESLDRMGMTADGYRPIYRRETKFSVPVADRFEAEPLPLGGVFELVRGETEKPLLGRIARLQGLHTLHVHTYRHLFLDGLGLRDWHFRSVADVLTQTELYRLHRPAEGFTASALAQLILTTVRKMEEDRACESFKPKATP